jgi:hypothetical protein
MAGILPASDLRSSPRTAVGRSDSPRLDGGTKLDRGWSAVAYPDAGELVAVGALIAQEESGLRKVDVLARIGPPSCAVLAPESTERAERRARGAIRRYAVANGLTRLATLTYAHQTDDAATVRRDFSGFSRRLRRTYPHLRWVRVFERHQSGMLHVHVGLSGYVPKSALADLWGHGFVDVRKIRTKGGGREDARAAARYLSKYVAKDAVADVGEHRYEIRQGFQPRKVRMLARSVLELEQLALAAGYVSGEPSYVWWSAQDPDHTGPPVYFAAY